MKVNALRLANQNAGKIIIIGTCMVIIILYKYYINNNNYNILHITHGFLATTCTLADSGCA